MDEILVRSKQEVANLQIKMFELQKQNQELL